MSCWGACGDDVGSSPQKSRKQGGLLDDAALAAELNELSFKEREHIFEVIHGVADGRVEETPELITAKMKELKEEISSISKRKRRDYERALFLKPGLEEDIDFHLMFLRSDSFDCRKSANRICSYFTNKLELFGYDKLVKRITLDDLDEDDMEAFRACTHIVLNHPDRAGRRVWIGIYNRLNFKHWKNHARCLWFRTMADFEMNHDLQANGTAAVALCVGMEGQNISKLIDAQSHSGKMVFSLPHRFVSYHFCYDSPAIQSAMAVVQMAMGKRNRLHFRPHFGSSMEVIYSLLSFGILIDERLLQDDDEYRRIYLEDYMQERRRFEEARRQEEMELVKLGKVPHPSPKDVLLGRGRPYQCFSGNAILNTFIEEGCDDYHLLDDKFEKTCFSMTIANKIHENGGRFLVRKDSCWQIADDVATRAKIGQALRMKAKSKDVSGNDTSLLAEAINGSQLDDASETPYGPPSAKKIRYEAEAGYAGEDQFDRSFV